jgi:methylenetetrahydrofolate dehydrogenase (NADP+)/methenyltetrahydrofolate cyclohydrolase
MTVKEGEIATTLDGKAVAAAVRKKVQEEVEELVKGGRRRPGLTVVLVGDDEASAIYVRNKIKACKQVGFESQLCQFDKTISQAKLTDCIKQLNADPNVDGILVQLPLPKHLSSESVLAVLSAEKDVDGLTILSEGLLFAGKPYLVPCTPLGIITLLDHYKVPIAGANAVVIGRSNLVGKPIAMLLMQRDATVTICHSKSKGLDAIARSADILVVAAGRKEFVPGSWIKNGACVIDVGIHHEQGGADSAGRICGDVKFAEALSTAGLITPVPGGVGPMTIAMLLSNTLTAYKKHEDLEK